MEGTRLPRTGVDHVVSSNKTSSAEFELRGVAESQKGSNCGDYIPATNPSSIVSLSRIPILYLSVRPCAHRAQRFDCNQPTNKQTNNQTDGRTEKENERTYTKARGPTELAFYERNSLRYVAAPPAPPPPHTPPYPAPREGRHAKRGEGASAFRRYSADLEAGVIEASGNFLCCGGERGGESPASRQSAGIEGGGIWRRYGPRASSIAC